MVELGEKEYQYNYNFGVLASKSADYIMLVNKKQTEPIHQALVNEKYPEDKIYINDTFTEAMQKARAIQKREKQKYIIIENDLPDNY
ncbi:MAG: hypothetical protein K2H53_01690 [Clostridia bacterium]|nr:hypothetical protein [Clostridia bacterium]